MSLVENSLFEVQPNDGEEIQQIPLKKILSSLEKLIVLQEDLFKVALEKTEIIIKNDLESIKAILKQENKYIQISQKLHEEIVKLSIDYLNEKGEADSNPALAKVIEYAPVEIQEELQCLKKQLEEHVFNLQHRNLLNQDLLNQSLQIINMTLDLMMPDMESINYHPSEQDEQKEAHSIFDSKA